MVDEAAIRRKVYDRSYTINVQENWRTPSGGMRRAPMYEASIRNSYLGNERVIKAKDYFTVKQKCDDQLKKWAEQEIKKRIGEAKKDATERAAAECDEADRQARESLEALRNILVYTLDIDDRLDWNELLDKAAPPPFKFAESAPKTPQKPPPPEPPRKSFWEWLMPSLKEKRLQQEAELEEGYARQWAALKEKYAAAKHEYDSRLAKAQKEHQHRCERFVADQERRNSRVMAFKSDFENGESEAIIEYLKEVFERSEYPDGFLLEHQVGHDPSSETVVVDISLPSQDEIPDVQGYTFVKSRREQKPVALKKKDHEALFDSVVKQCVLRTIHEVFESLYTPHVHTVVVNGWVTALNPATGHDETSCVISISAEREEFEAINLARVDPSECIKQLKGLIAGPLSQLAPVQPIMKLDRNDSRFVESREVLAEHNSKSNLAEMPWEEFEHLVRELFSELFSGEDTEVRVTQTSSDGGVDAIAFDPDPIRGGKYVIQAKRYTNTVPVSAVRDLYGTMIAEGATKGILVTTSQFGRETRRFAKDKPISLIDGQNLVYLLEEQGYQVRLDVEAAKAKRKAQYFAG